MNKLLEFFHNHNKEAFLPAINEVTTAHEIKAEDEALDCKEEPLEFFGTGPMTIRGINLPAGTWVIQYTHDGEGAFISSFIVNDSRGSTYYGSVVDRNECSGEVLLSDWSGETLSEDIFNGML